MRPENKAWLLKVVFRVLVFLLLLRTLPYWARFIRVYWWAVVIFVITFVILAYLKSRKRRSVETVLKIEDKTDDFKSE
jgi:hypothetical protein